MLTASQSRMFVQRCMRISLQAVSRTVPCTWHAAGKLAGCSDNRTYLLHLFKPVTSIAVRAAVRAVWQPTVGLASSMVIAVSSACLYVLGAQVTQLH